MGSSCVLRQSGADGLRFRRFSPDATDTKGLGRLFGRWSPDGAVLLLEGPLGAGKTTFAQGVAAGCGISEPVASPTYNVVLHHEGRRPFVHADLYRLPDASALETLDLAEILSPPVGVACIEWPALVADRVVPPFAWIELAREGQARRIAGRLVGEGWAAVKAALEEDAKASREGGG